MKPLFLITLALSFTHSLSFRILVQPTTSVGAPTTVLWVKNASDPSPLENLRFVTTVDGKDEPLKRSNANFNVNSPGGANAGVHSLGKESFVFQKAGKYQVKAIFGEDDKVLGTSNDVTVSEASGRPASAAQATATDVVSRKPSNKTPLVVGALLGALLILLILIALVRFLLHRRQLQREKDRLSFHPEGMSQRRRSLWMDGAQGDSVIEGGAVVVERPENPFAGGINFTIDVEAGRRESVINPFRDPPRSAMPIPSIEPASQSTRPENPFDPSSTRDHTAPLDSSVKATGDPGSVAYLESGVTVSKEHVLASPAIAPSRYRSIKTARPPPNRPLPTPLLLHKGHLGVHKGTGSKSLPQVPLSAPVQQSEFNRDVEIPPSPLTPSRSKPQRLMDRRLEQVQSQLDILRRRRQREGVDEDVANKVEGDLERKADWLRKEIVRGWSADVEEDDLVLPGEDVKKYGDGSARV